MNAIGKATVIGAGLAGSEAAYQLSQRGVSVNLYEMRPATMTPAHRSGLFAELVCSNSLKSEDPASAPYLLKEELRILGSLLLRVAGECRVPAGQALAVDRQCFSSTVTQNIRACSGIKFIQAEVLSIPSGKPTVIASGPLTSEALTSSLQSMTGQSHLYFYDAISPIVSSESIDHEVAFAASRYGKGTDDYLNCPLNETEYRHFVDALLTAEKASLRDFEKPAFFEGCLPIEVLAARGADTLRFGPMKPVGLLNPRTGVIPYAVVQLRRENIMADAYNLVGFQNHMRYGEQSRVLRMIPGLGRANFIRFGQIHRNTYVNAPQVLTPFLECKNSPGLFLAGQICGLEGYIEAIATGILTAIQVERRLRGTAPLLFPRETALGSLQHYLANADAANYQPVNMTLSLLPESRLSKKNFPKKSERNTIRIKNALQTFRDFSMANNLIING